MTTARIGIEHIPFNPGLRRARLARGWTRAQLAQEAKVSQQAVGDYERLKKWPTVQNAERISLTLRIPEDSLFPEQLGFLVKTSGGARRVSTEVEVLALDFIPAGLLEWDGNLSEAESFDRHERIEQVISTLTAREADVVRRRYGLAGAESQTLEQVASAFHVTKERIRQIETRALRKLRHPTRTHVLRDYPPEHPLTLHERREKWDREHPSARPVSAVSDTLGDIADARLRRAR